jgi:ABC-type proline/glycine betaine transport system permease subunit
MMVAFFGTSIMNACQGEFVTAAVMAALAIVVAIAIALIVRRFARRDDKDAKSEE